MINDPFKKNCNKLRAQAIWDYESDFFIEKTSKTLFIPAKLSLHSGEIVDNMSYLKRSEHYFNTQISKLFKLLKIQH